MLDYLIVGFGLAGASIAARLEKMNKSFIVFEDNSQQSSKVAGGIMNPVILKRFTLAWKANEQLEAAKLFYGNLEEKLEEKFLFPLEIYRKFNSAEEQNNWFAAADAPHLAPFLDTPLHAKIKASKNAIPAEFSFGKVLQTAKVDTGKFLSSYAAFLLRNKKMKSSKFVYEDLIVGDSEVEYHGIKAKKIIFCDGFGMLKNPFFNYLPLVGNKGEYLIVKSPELRLQVAVKASVFILPLGNDLYKVGATYNHKDKTILATSEARKELVEKLDKIINVDYEIVNQVAGIRPSTIDRRPLIGRHPKYKNMYCCNGFGSRGVLIAPNVSVELLNFIENSEAISAEIDISRFVKKWVSS